jgi:hypothetical protein
MVRRTILKIAMSNTWNSATLLTTFKTMHMSFKCVCNCFQAQRWRADGRFPLVKIEDASTGCAGRMLRVRYTEADVEFLEVTISGGRTLHDVPWDSAHVQALLSDVGEKTYEVLPQDRIPCMDKDDAEKVFEQAAAEGLALMCQKLQLGPVNT